MSEKYGALWRDIVNSGAFDRLMSAPISAATPTAYNPTPLVPIRSAARSAPVTITAKSYTYEITPLDEAELSAPGVEKMLAEIRERYWREVLTPPTPPAPVTVIACPDCARAPWGLKCTACLSREV